MLATISDDTRRASRRRPYPPRVSAFTTPFSNAPYAIGLVDLDEQVRLMCRVIGTPASGDIGSPVRLVTLAYEDGPLFAVRIVPAASS